MDVNEPLQLLGGISPALFMRRYWHKKPLLVRQAIAGFAPALDPAALFRLAGNAAVQSRLVTTSGTGHRAAWTLRQGPFARRSLPRLAEPGWTLLVQGVDLLRDEVHAVRDRFRFVPDARLDDVMVSYASDAGGVGPHFDSYDVFLLQTRGRRRWRVGLQKDLSLRDGLPLKILKNFAPDTEYDLEPGDMLYLPPGIAHDGVARGACMTWSIGFRAPDSGELAAELLQRLVMDASDTPRQHRYRDPRQRAVGAPAAIPASILGFARASLHRVLGEPYAVERVLGETLTEPKPDAWFEATAAASGGAVVLDHKTRMMYDLRHVFINGESFVASGRDAVLMRALAGDRHLSAAALRRASRQALGLLSDWQGAGWIHG